MRVQSITLKVLAVLKSFSKEIQVTLSIAVSKEFGLRIGIDTLPKAQRNQRIENFDSINTFLVQSRSFKNLWNHDQT